MGKRYQFTRQDRSKGGRAVATRRPPEYCPRCGQPMSHRRYHSYLGHLGLHGLADRYFGGDVVAAQRRLQRNGLARQDPYPQNHAWPKYRPVTGGNENECFT